MTTTEILKKANEIVKNSNFTKILKARKNAPLHLPFFISQHYTLWLSYTNENIYLTIGENVYILK